MGKQMENGRNGSQQGNRNKSLRGGRKTETIIVSENYASSSKVNCSAPARNLTKSDIGAVIFGCKRTTMEECYSKKLFGLPHPHYSCVKKIDLGLPLFLFNYSDRTLHGVFEAACCGQLNIDQSAWTDNDCNSTPYPAQVKIKVQKLCQPLTEAQFRPSISRNYYREKLFWFELDHNQTKKLITLFSSFPITSTTSLPKHMQRLNSLLEDSCDPHLPKKANYIEAPNTDQGNFVSAWDDPHDAIEGQAPNTNQGNFVSAWDDPHEAIEGQGTLGVFCMPYDGKNEQVTTEVNPTFGRSYSSVVKNTGFSVAPFDAVSIFSTSQIDKEVDAHGHQFDADWDPWDASSCKEAWASEQSISKDASENLNQEDFNTTAEEKGSSCTSSCLYLESGPSEAPKNEDRPILYENADICPGEAVFTVTNSSNLYSIVKKLLSEVEDLKESKLMQDQKIESLKQELVESRSEIQKLKKQWKMLGCSILASNEEEEHIMSVSKLILVAGGCDGYLWLSSLHSYSPSLDQWCSLSSMNSGRANYAAARINGEFYAIGGECENMWYNTVESYNPVSNQWTYRPSLSKQKGSLAGVSLNGKIYTVGGGDGVGCFSEVEIFDLHVGRWILDKSMLHKRFVPAAAELNGVLYVVGGYDGKNYLKSIERYDPRESSWVELESMKTKKGCHCVAVLNEKLYALGGYDGENMVSTVEIFDPRQGSWVMGEPMSNCRGYFGTVVIGETIYSIGGLNDIEALDTVEVYKEGQGWQMTNIQGMGKRCFFSAITL